MVYELLSEGAENARTGRELCRLLEIQPRELTQAIARERRAGHPICAATGKRAGYFLAADREEMQRYCRSLWRRAGEIFKTRRACLATIETLPPPEEPQEQEAG